MSRQDAKIVSLAPEDSRFLLFPGICFCLYDCNCLYINGMQAIRKNGVKSVWRVLEAVRRWILKKTCVKIVSCVSEISCG